MKNPIPEHPIATLVTAGGVAGAITVGAITGLGGGGAEQGFARFAAEARGGLVQAERVAEWIESSRPVAIVDTRLGESFDSGHVPDSVSLPLERIDLRFVDAPGETASSALRDALIAAGIERGKPVVVVDDGSRPGLERAAYACWLLSITDAGPCNVLEGGVPGWRAAGLALDVVVRPVETDGFLELLDAPASLTTFGSTRAATLDASAALIDARRARDGDEIPGSWRMPVERIVGDDGRVNRESLAAWIYRTGLFADDHRIVYGDGGRDGALGWFLLGEVAELDGVKLFPGGMPVWKTYPHLPVARHGTALAASSPSR